MTSSRDKWIRPLKHNPAGKVVSGPNGNRWQWEEAADDETGRLLRQLQNDELAIERSDVFPTSPLDLSARRTGPFKGADRTKPIKKKSKSRDPGGGFNPYDNPGKPDRR